MEFKLITQRIDSAMATGNWVGGRKGVCQRIQRLNFLETLSHLQRVVSPLSASQENFQARELHATHLGRLCPIETPEGTNIGLRKNLALLCKTSHQSDEEELLKHIKNGVMIARINLMGCGHLHYGMQRGKNYFYHETELVKKDS